MNGIRKALHEQRLAEKWTVVEASVRDASGVWEYACVFKARDKVFRFALAGSHDSAERLCLSFGAALKTVIDDVMLNGLTHHAAP